MPKASRRRQSHGANDFSGEIDTLRESMHSLEDKLCKVEKDKEHLRSFNQVLIEKLKNSTEMDLCLKVGLQINLTARSSHLNFLLILLFVCFKALTISNLFLK